MISRWQSQDAVCAGVAAPRLPKTSVPSRGYSVSYTVFPLKFAFFHLSQFLLASQSKPVLERLRVYLCFHIYRFAYLRKVSRKFPYLELETRKFREEGGSVSFELLGWCSVLVLTGCIWFSSDIFFPFWTAHLSYYGSSIQTVFLVQETSAAFVWLLLQKPLWVL